MCTIELTTMFGKCESVERKVNTTQRRVQPDQCYFTVQFTGNNFDCSL